MRLGFVSRVQILRTFIINQVQKKISKFFTIFKKTQKNTHFGATFGPLCQIWENRIFLKKTWSYQYFFPFWVEIILQNFRTSDQILRKSDYRGTHRLKTERPFRSLLVVQKWMKASLELRLIHLFPVSYIYSAVIR